MVRVVGGLIILFAWAVLSAIAVRTNIPWVQNAVVVEAPFIALATAFTIADTLTGGVDRYRKETEG